MENKKRSLKGKEKDPLRCSEAFIGASVVPKNNRSKNVMAIRIKGPIQKSVVVSKKNEFHFSKNLIPTVTSLTKNIILS